MDSSFDHRDVLNPDLLKSQRIGTCFAVIFLLALIGVGTSGGLETWIPARWQGGPLELQRRVRTQNVPTDPVVRETIAQWYDPATLSLLQGTPINCLLVTWSGGGSPETEQQQQQLIKTYAREARKLGISVLGIVYPGRAPSVIVESAVDAGLEGLVLEGEFPDSEFFIAEARKALRDRNSPAVVIRMTPSEKLTPSVDAPILAPLNPAIPRIRESVDGVEATPSSEPWIDSNIWLGVSLHSWCGSRPVWLGEQLAANAAPEDYLRAIADAAAGGSRWILALSDDLQNGLCHQQAEALGTWRRIAAYLKFQQEHTEWIEYPPFADYGFIQDSAGKDRVKSDSNLILAVRQRIPLRVIERSQLNPSALEGLQAVHGIGLIQPSEPERKVLSTFAQDGGLVVVGPSWKQTEPSAETDFEIERSGKGRVVVYNKEWPEGTSLSKDLIDLLSRENFGVRFFRVTSVLGHVSMDKSGSRMLVQLVNYATYPADSVLVRITGNFRTARLYTPENPVAELGIVKFDRQIEVNIPRLSIYGGLLLER
jgi:hypothetical protein